MPEPIAGESQQAYISRFMKSQEAQGSFPNGNQRLAVAYNMYKQRHQANLLRQQKIHPLT